MMMLAGGDASISLSNRCADISPILHTFAMILRQGKRRATGADAFTGFYVTMMIYGARRRGTPQARGRHTTRTSRFMRYMLKWHGGRPFISGS